MLTRAKVKHSEDDALFLQLIKRLGTVSVLMVPLTNNPPLPKLIVDEHAYITFEDGNVAPNALMKYSRARLYVDDVQCFSVRTKFYYHRDALDAILKDEHNFEVVPYSYYEMPNKLVLAVLKKVNERIEAARFELTAHQREEEELIKNTQNKINSLYQ